MMFLRKRRLWKHLLKVEKVTGGSLIVYPRYAFTDCPIANFAPEYDGAGRLVQEAAGGMLYRGEDDKPHWYNCVYQEGDTLWWARLPLEKRHEVTRWVITKINERNNDARKDSNRR